MVALVVGCFHDDQRSAGTAIVTTRRVAWRRSDEVEADEHCTLSLRETGLSLVGTVIGAEDGVPVRIEYRVLADRTGLTTATHVRAIRFGNIEADAGILPAAEILWDRAHDITKIGLTGVAHRLPI